MLEILYRRDLNKLFSERNLPLTAAEIGVAEGRFSLEMLRDWGLDRLYLVDLWCHIPGMGAELGKPAGQAANHDACLEKLRDYRGHYTILQGWSHVMANEVPDGSLGMVYIDATHEYIWVKKDLEAWYPKLVPGGIMAGHDYLNPRLTVQRAVDEFASKVGSVVYTIPEQDVNDSGFWFTRGTDD